MKKCPYCTHICPDAAFVCLCGYNFDMDGSELCNGDEITTSYMLPDQELRIRAEVDFMLEKVSIDKSATKYGIHSSWPDVVMIDMSRSEAVEFILKGFNMENCKIRRADEGSVEACHYYENCNCWMPYACVIRIGSASYMGIHSTFDESW